jgi:hypothetical protein
MFELESDLTFISAGAEEVIDIYTSINRSTVAPPGLTPEPAQAFIATVYKDGAYMVHIYLHLTNSNSGILYSWSEGPVAAEVVSNLYQSAFEFTESMGFMMDDMRYRDKAGEEKSSTWQQVPMFHQDLSSFAVAEEEAEEGENLEELVIESLDAAEEVEEIEEEVTEELNLDVLGTEEDLTPQEDEVPIEEITLGSGDDADEEGVPEIEASLEDESELEPEEDEGALDALEMIEPGEEEASLEALIEEEEDPEEESLLESLEMEGEPDTEDAIEEIQMEMTADEETVEAEPVAEALIDEEVELTSEENDILGGFDGPADEEPAEATLDEIEEEEEVTLSAEPSLEPEDEEVEEIEMPVAEAEPSETLEPEPEIDEPDVEEQPTGVSSPAPASIGVDDISEDDYSTLVTFLAMM